MITAEYSIRRTSLSIYEVAKFSGKKWPEVVYCVDTTYGGYSCSCPARGECKHMDLVVHFVRHDSPILNCFWFEKDGVINGCVMKITRELREEIENAEVVRLPRRAPSVRKQRRPGRNRG